MGPLDKYTNGYASYLTIELLASCSKGDLNHPLCLLYVQRVEDEQSRINQTAQSLISCGEQIHSNLEQFHHASLTNKLQFLGMSRFWFQKVLTLQEGSENIPLVSMMDRILCRDNSEFLRIYVLKHLVKQQGKAVVQSYIQSNRWKWLTFYQYQDFDDKFDPFNYLGNRYRTLKPLLRNCAQDEQALPLLQKEIGQLHPLDLSKLLLFNIYYEVTPLFVNTDSFTTPVENIKHWRK